MFTDKSMGSLMSETNSPQNMLFEPPDELDGAEVILWAYNPTKPFFIMRYVDGSEYKPIHGFAICRYKGSDIYYKFSCDRDWNVEGDSDKASMEEAMETAQNQSCEPLTWNTKESRVL
jgi:hypothetical protein